MRSYTVLKFTILYLVLVFGYFPKVVRLLVSTTPVEHLTLSNLVDRANIYMSKNLTFAKHYLQSLLFITRFNYTTRLSPTKIPYPTLLTPM